MFKIEELLQNKDYEVDSFSGNIYANNGIVKYLVVRPHEGNGYKYLLRVSTCAAFDRWANSIPIEEFFDTEEDLVNYILNNQLEIYKILLEYLSDEYYDLEKCFYEVSELAPLTL